ncbi:P2Y purinoceptor 3-like [Hemitrygon akajei]|uniref:P2Y purinoceptor 3-like n=1 Tax=Hemitrygon akajei TaxID=2704970 RepID=UPI003BF95685
MTVNTTINNSSCKPQHMDILIPAFLSIIFALGFVLSALSLYTFWFRFKRWNTGMIIQFNLALSDIIIAPTAPLIVISFSLSNQWPFGQFLCQLEACLLSAHMYGSTYFLTLVSVHRYSTVVHLTKNSVFKNQKFVKSVCLAVWIFLFVKGLPFFFILRASKVDNITQCLSIHQTEMASLFFIWSMVNLFPGLVIPFGVSVICYCLLGCYIVKMGANLPNGKGVKVKSMGIIAVSLITFVGCCFPVQLSRSAAVIVKQFYPGKCQWLLKFENLYYIFFVLANVRCCLDTLLYWFSSRKFQASFKGILQSFRCQCKMQGPVLSSDTSV